MEQLMEITSPFGDAVRFETMQAREELGRLAEYDITVLSAKETLLPKDCLLYTSYGLRAGGDQPACHAG